MNNKEIDIATNLKVVEWLKAELVESLGILLKALLKANLDVITDALATVIIICYILGRRVGVSFQNVDIKIRHKLQIGIDEAEEIEQWYGDLSDLKKYMENKKR